MPKFLDIHDSMPEMPPEVAQQAAQMMRAGELNDRGCRGIDLLIADDGSGYCLSEGPSKEAVVASHQDLGLDLAIENVKEVTSVLDA